MSKSQPFDDIDLMTYADGELDDSTARAIAAYVADSDDARVKLAGLDEIHESVRTHLELAADDAEPRFEDLWAAVEAGLGAEAVTSAPAAKALPQRQLAGKGIWQRLGDWLDQHTGYLMTGAVAAGAAAALMLLFRPPEVIEKPTIVYTNPSTARTRPAATLQLPVLAAPSAPEIELLEVNEGSGSVFVIPGEGEDDISTTVIFVDISDVEGPL